MKFYKLRTSKLKKIDILNIINLKNSHWKFGINSQFMWFKDNKNVFQNDLHFFIKKKQSVIAYVQIGKRKLIINENEKKYALFKTLIISKKERGKNLSKKIMYEVLRYIDRRNLPCFLLCKKNLVNFYKKFNFIILKKKKYKLNDHKSLLYGMIYNLKKIDELKKKTFFYYT